MRWILLVLAGCASTTNTAAHTPLPNDTAERAKWDERMAALRSRATLPRVGDTLDAVVATCRTDEGELNVQSRDKEESDVGCAIGGVVVFRCRIAYRVVLEGALPEPAATSCSSR
jgi:hypothetical protein